MEYYRFITWLIDISFRSTLLIFGIMFIRKIFVDKLNPRGVYYLWLVLLLRLTIPITYNSRFNIYTIGARLFSFNNIHSQTITNDQITNETLYSKITVSKDINLDVSTLSTVHIYRFIFVIWFIITAIVLIRVIVANTRFASQLNNDSEISGSALKNIFDTCALRMNINEMIPLYYSTKVSSPAIYGIIKPKILLPKGICAYLSSDDYRYIFYHELSHYKRKDMIVLWLLTVLKCIHWFNPFIIWGVNKMIQDSELACDSLALSYIDETEFIQYGNTLLNIISLNRNKKRNILATCTLGDKNYLKRRIDMISKFKKNNHRISIFTIITIILVSLLFLTNPLKNEVLATNSTTESETIQEATIDEDYTWPLETDFTIVSTYGMKMHPILKTEKKHTGVDIKSDLGTDIYATRSGLVLKSKTLSLYGKTVIIDHGNGVTSHYSHCNELLVQEGDNVTNGQLIARVGKTGAATGPHLHFEMRQDDIDFDPLSLFDNTSK